MKLVESAFVEAGSLSAGERMVDMTIIAAGWGNKTHNHYYPADTLRRAADAQVFDGVKMYANHLSEAQRKQLGGLPRSIWDIVGRVERTWWDDASQSLKGRAKLVPNFYDLVASDPGLVEASINAGGTARPSVIDGRNGRLVEAIEAADSVDWVSVGGAGGKIDALLEAQREDVMDQLESLTIAQLVEANPVLIKEILESPLNEDRTELISLREAAEEETESEAVVEDETEVADEAAEEGHIRMTEAELDRLVEARATEAAQKIIDQNTRKDRQRAEITKLVEAAELPALSAREIRTRYADSNFPTMERLRESVGRAIKRKQAELEQFVAGQTRVRDLGGNGAALVEAGTSRRGTRGENDAKVDRAMGLDDES